MHFNIEHDSGERITGYLVPDSFTSLARVRLVNGGEIVSIFETNEPRPSLVVGGRHESGLCGFTIDDTMIPNLIEQFELEIFDDETGCLVYRRARPEMISRRVLRLETQLLPQWRLDDCLFRHFQYTGRGIERFGRETITQMFLLMNVSSQYISGRINYKSFVHNIEDSFECFCMIQSPYDECAERLLVLRNAAQFGASFLGERDAKRYEPAMRFAESLPFDKPKALRTILERMPEEVGTLLANPLTRLLTTSNPDDMPGPSAIASALDILSSFSVIGLRVRGQEFKDMVSEWLGIQTNSLPLLPPLSAISPFGDFLKEIKSIAILLEKDVELYHYVEEANRPFDGVTSTAPTVIDGTATSVPS